MKKLLAIFILMSIFNVSYGVGESANCGKTDENGCSICGSDGARNAPESDQIVADPVKTPEEGTKVE